MTSEQLYALATKLEEQTEIRSQTIFLILEELNELGVDLLPAMEEEK